jgi:hypothetical protein
MNHELDIVGFPATVVTWLSLLNIVTVTPMVTFVASSMSIVWLSMQIYGWVEKRIKNGRES